MEDPNPEWQCRLEAIHPKGRFARLAFDVQIVTPKTVARNTTQLAVVDVFTRYIRASAIPNEQAEKIAQELIDEWISLFGPMERFLSDSGPSLTGAVMKNLANYV